MDKNKKFNQFMKVFNESLKDCVKEFPGMYPYSTQKILQLTERTKAAILRDTCFYDTPVFRRTCNKLGIKASKKSIREFCNLDVKKNKYWS